MIIKNTIQNFKEYTAFLFKLLFFTMFSIMFFCPSAMAALMSESFDISSADPNYYGENITGSFMFNTVTNSISSVSINGTMEPFTADQAFYNTSKNEMYFDCAGTCQEGHFNPHFQHVYLYLSSLNGPYKPGAQQIAALYIAPEIYGQQYDFSGTLRASTVPLPPSIWFLGLGLVGIILGKHRKNIIGYGV